MVVLHPFRAVRPVRELANKIACVPYDVISTEEASLLAAGNADSFLHVIRPEVDVPDRESDYDDRVYKKGAENLAAYIASDRSVQDKEPSVYLYRLVMDGRSQTGIFACVSVDDYDNDTILKHELTRPAKENDRTRHILAQQAHAEPIMLTFRDDPEIESEMASVSAGDPLYDLTSDDGVRHTIWKFSDPGAIVSLFGKLDKLYIADGHHRCKAASRAAKEHASGPSSEEVNYFPAVLFPMGQMTILPYNRVILSIQDSPEQFLGALRERFEMEENVDPTPQQKGNISIYLSGTWYGVRLSGDSEDGVTGNLDVDKLSRQILDPFFSITDPRTDPNIDFVGGIRGTRALERLVEEGKVALAISMYATSIEELVAVSDAGKLMPPKSTWFEPKLRSGLLVHTF